jgi:hypothetical protein
MNKIIVFICSLLILNTSLSAQKYEPVAVRAGTKVIDYFPPGERYRYPEFVSGRVQFKNGIYSETWLNYNFLMGEMEFIKSKDTLTIINKKDIRYVAVAQDTFFYDKGYLELISGGPVRVALKQYIKLKEVLKKDSYGTSSSGSATNSYGSLPVDGSFYKLAANEDMVFQKTLEYYLATSSSGFVQFSKKNVIQLFPQKEDVIKAYLKSNKVNFEKRDDLIRLADYLSTL